MLVFVLLGEVGWLLKKNGKGIIQIEVGLSEVEGFAWIFSHPQSNMGFLFWVILPENIHHLGCPPSQSFW